MLESFALSFQGDPVELVNRAKQVAAKNHFQFHGDEHSGNFSGNGVAGTYRVQEQTVTVTITQKPFFISMATIEDHIKPFFT